MEMPVSVSLELASADETSAFASCLSPLLRAGDTLLLSGPIGAGKTHFARSLIQARLAASGRSEEVPSPTYTLVQTYDDGACELWHADLYRLTTPDEVAELGLDEAFERAIVLVEWPDRLGSMVPAAALVLEFAHTTEPSRRRLVLSSADPAWTERLRPMLSQETTDA